jgi:hypothetical protein
MISRCPFRGLSARIIVVGEKVQVSDIGRHLHLVHSLGAERDPAGAAGLVHRR